MIFTTSQMTSAIHELTGQKWVTEETVKKLNPKEFRYLDILIHKNGTEEKIHHILSNAHNRK